MILIVDREDLLGSSLADQIGTENVIVAPFSLSLPKIPDGNYTTIIFVWDKKDDAVLVPLAERAVRDNAKLFVVVQQDDMQEVEKVGHTGTILVLGDLFDASDRFALGAFLQKAKSTKKITLPHMGLHGWHPVAYSDVVKKVAELSRQTKLSHEFYFLGPQHEYTALSIAHALQKVDPDLVVDFLQDTEGETRERNHLPRSAFDQYDSLKMLQQAYQHMMVKRVQEPSVSVVFHQVAKKKKKPLWGWYIGYLFVLILFFPLFSAITTGAAGYFLLTSGMQSIEKGQWAIASKKVQAAGINFSISQSALAIVAQESRIVGQEKLVSSFDTKLTSARLAARLVEHGAQASDLLTGVLSGKTNDPVGQTEEAAADMKQALLLLQEIDSKTIPQQYASDVDSLKQLGGQLGGVLDSLPTVLGVRGSATYLILFQNNMELRPGGGFIGSYGLLHLEKGKVKDFTIHDVYDADGQLKGHIEPPFAIRRYIPVVHLYLRDSNFDPDFTVNAQKAALLLSQETGDQVDGVVGIDLTTLKSVLSATGSVYVPSYNQTVTADNFFTLLEQHAEKGFFPGSTQKKDFLRAVAVALFHQLQTNSLHISRLLGSATKLFAGKDILVSFANSTIQQPFTLAGVSGSLVDTRPNNSGVVNDFLGIIEANLGVNKVNAFVTRQVSQQVTVDEKGNIAEQTTLTVTNNSDGTWPGGAYTNYLRFYLPRNAVLGNVLLNNVVQHTVPAVTDPKIYEEKGFIAPKGLEVDKEVESGKSVYGMLITVPEKKTVDITITYTIPQAFAQNSQKQTYDLLLWKQAGVDPYPYTLSVAIPQSVRFIESSSQIPQDSQTFSLSKEIAGDTNMRIVTATK